ncbi:MAG: caspase family protein [bacterium]
MKNNLYWFGIVLIASSLGWGQEAKERSKTFSIDPLGKPASLSIVLNFEEPSKNVALDAGEKGSIVALVTNAGGMRAKGVVASIKSLSTTGDIEFPVSILVGDIDPKASKTVRFELSASEKLKNDYVTFTVEAVDANAIKAQPQLITFATKEKSSQSILLMVTQEFQYPAGKNTLEAGENGTLIVKVENKGNSTAKNVTARVKPQEFSSGISMSVSKQVGEIPPNGSGVIRFELTTMSSARAEDLSIVIEVSDDTGIKAESKPIVVAIRALVNPAVLTATVQFSDPSNNSALDANEKGNIIITVTNSGGSVAKNVTARLKNPMLPPGVSVPVSQKIGDIKPGAIEMSRLEIAAEGQVRSEDITLSFEISDDAGVKIETTPLSVSVKGAIKPTILAAAIQLIEPSNNGLLDAGEKGSLIVKVTNSGGMQAKNVIVKLNWSPALQRVTVAPSAVAGDIAPMMTKEARFDLEAAESAANQTTQLTVDVEDAAGVKAAPLLNKFEIKGKILARDITPPQIEIWEPVVTAVRGIKIIPSESRYATQTSSVVVRGVAKDTSGVARVTVNGEEARLTIGRDGFDFVGEALLVLGENEIDVRALDRYKNESKLTFKITRNPEVIVDIPVIPPSFLKGQRWAVVVGISKYKSGDIPQLRYADRDADAFHDLLTTPIESGGMGVPRTNIRRLTNDQATSSNVREALTDFLKSAIEDDQVYIYFAGHGAPDPDRPKILYLLTYDSDLTRLASTSVKMQDIQVALDDYVTAKNVLVFADACHSRGATGMVTTRALATSDLVNEYFSELARARSGRITFAASDVNQLSQEDAKWGGGHGVFTHYLLEGLKGKADSNGDRMVRLGELTQYVTDNVRRETKAQQSPISSGSYDINLPLTIVVK